MTTRSVRRQLNVAQNGRYLNTRSNRVIDPRGFYLRGAFNRASRPVNSTVAGAVSEFHNYGDPRFVRFLLSLAEHGQDIPAGFDPGTGFTRAGAMPHTTDAMLSICNMAYSPRGYVAATPDALRGKLGLRSSFRSTRHAQLLDALIDDFASISAPSGTVRIQPGTSAGAPTMEVEKSTKLPVLQHILDNEEAFMTLHEQDKIDEMMRRYKAAPLITVGGRLQTESPTKKRTSVSLEGAFADYSVDEIDVDKTVPDGVLASAENRFCRQRARLVHGVPAAYNVLIAKRLDGHDEAFRLRYASGLKVREPSHLRARFRFLYRKFTSPRTIFFDVSKYDNTIPAFVVDRMCERLKQYWPERAVELMRDTFCMAKYVPTDTDAHLRGEPSAVLLGDPTDRVHQRETYFMFASGGRWTSIFGTLINLWDFVCAYDDVFTSDKSVSEAFAEAIGIIDWTRDSEIHGYINSDDCFICGNEADVESIVAAVKNNAYFDKAPEDESRVAGYVISRDETNRDFMVYQNLASYMEHVFAPEKDYRNPNRRNALFGDAMRITLNAETPHFGTLLDLIDRLHSEQYGVSYRDWLFSHDVSTLLTIDDIVRAQAEAFRWKYSAADFGLSDEQLSELLDVGYASYDVEALGHDMPNTRFITREDAHALEEASNLTWRQYV